MRPTLKLQRPDNNQRPTDIVGEAAGFLLAAMSVLFCGSLLSYHPLDASWLHHTVDAPGPTRNSLGPFGAQLSATAFGLLGIAALWLPAIFGLAALRRLTVFHRKSEVVGRRTGIIAILLVSPPLLQLLLGNCSWRGASIDSGGAIGIVVSEFLASELNSGGAFLVLLFVLLVATNLVAGHTLKGIAAKFLRLEEAQPRKEIFLRVLFSSETVEAVFVPLLEDALEEEAEAAARGEGAVRLYLFRLRSWHSLATAVLLQLAESALSRMISTLRTLKIIP